LSKTQKKKFNKIIEYSISKDHNDFDLNLKTITFSYSFW